MGSYKRWIWHGETDNVGLQEGKEEDDYEGDRLEDMIRDANENLQQSGKGIDASLSDAKEPLYTGCSKFSKLSAIVKLYNLKAANGCVHKIAEVPIGFNEDRQLEQHILKKEKVEWQARYIADAMKNALKNHVFFAPYNAKRHWMLCIVNPFKEIAYWLDLLGMKVRKDFKFIIETAMKLWIAQTNLNRYKKSLKWIEIKCLSDLSGTKLPKDKVDEVRDQWVTFVQRFML